MSGVRGDTSDTRPSRKMNASSTVTASSIFPSVSNGTRTVSQSAIIMTQSGTMMLYT